MSKKTLMLLVAFLTIFSMILASCGPAEAPATAEEPVAAEQEQAAEEPAEAAEEPMAEGDVFTIGISNPFISSEYRTQMIAELIEVNAEYMAEGVTTELVIESADTDVAGQIQQLQNLMAKEVDAILVNPGDVNGLNATLEEAVAKGIIVISVDQELEVPGVYNVGIDQKEWAKTSAKWMAEALGGEGDIVQIEGFPGHPANVARMDGVAEVLADYPGINVLATDTGKWDEATGQQVMSNFLAAYPTLNGYWTQDGMAIGALQAVMAASPAEYPVVVGEGRCQFLNLWSEVLAMDPGFETIAVANPPGVSPTGLRIAVNMLMGKMVDETTLGGANGQSFVIDVPVIITPENLDEGLAICADKPDAYLLDGIMTNDEVLDAYFVHEMAAMEPVTIGISNPFISSEYRTQMIAELIEVNAEYMAKGLTTELVIESADTDVAGQIQQLQNLMAKEVDAILVNPGDVNGLNATLEEALAKGIIVISVDQELDVPGVYNVGIDQKEWAKTSAKWLAEALGGEGDIVQIEGFPGHPANVARMDGVAEVLADYPGINVLATDTGKWDEATGQQVMSNFLAAYPTLNGYWTQDGMAIGALQAVMAASPAEYPVVVGEGRCQFLSLWSEVLATDPGFETIAVANPPGVSPTGLRIAVNMLMGKMVDEAALGGVNSQSFVIEVPVIITPENLDEGLAICADKPDAYLLDGIMTDDEVVSMYFQ
ncbi:MAG: substrate-binding domain-containing protein [Anaerolineaceae bacterium]|nr:substrate-binding domain-containing protein [Anaerolineaceae bacterium]